MILHSCRVDANSSATLRLLHPGDSVDPAEFGSSNGVQVKFHQPLLLQDHPGVLHGKAKQLFLFHDCVGRETPPVADQRFEGFIYDIK